MTQHRAVARLDPSRSPRAAARARAGDPGGAPGCSRSWSSRSSAPIPRRWRNAFEVLRLSVEIGLLALALTPVITSGGIDLSVGSLMGLSAVVFGKLWRDAGLPIGAAARADAGPGRAGRQRQRAADHAWADPAADRDPRLVLAVPRPGRGADRRRRQLHRISRELVPLPRPGLLARRDPDAGADLRRRWPRRSGCCLHRTTSAAAWSRSASRPRGPATPGCRSSGWSRLVYVLSGLVAEPGGDHLCGAPGPGQGRRRHRLRAGGDHGRRAGRHVDLRRPGERPGTLLGLFAIAVLQNGLRLADLPAELAGVLTGTLAPGGDRARPSGQRPGRAPAPASHSIHPRRSSTVKNSQVAVICAAILAAALIIAAGNVFLVRSLQQRAPGRRSAVGPTRSTPPRGRRSRHGPITVAMMPKSKGNAYFIACRKGAEEAAKELGVKLIWDGPTDPDPAKQNEVDRHLDHPRRRRHRRGRREPRGDLLGAAQGPRARHQGPHLGRRRRARRPRLLRQPGHARGDRPDPDGQRRARAGRQGGVRHHHRLAHRGQHDRVAEDASRPAARRNTRRSRWPRCGPATTSRRRRSTRPTRS